MSLNWDISKVRNWQMKQVKDGHTLDCLVMHPVCQGRHYVEAVKK